MTEPPVPSQSAPSAPAPAQAFDADGSLLARDKFHCPACGAEANWNPAKQALICPFCGTESPAKLTTREDGVKTIVEHDLVAALRNIPDSKRGWQTDKISVKCQSCQAISVFDPGKVGQRCDFCGSSSLVPYEEVKDAFRPESLLPLRISEDQARDFIRSWYNRQWLAPNTFKKRALTDTVKGIYLPYWTFDAKVDARWSADSGRYYYVQSGNTREQRVEWTPVSGQLSHFFNDELVCASVGVDGPRLRRVEPFPTDSLVPYDPGYLSGWTVERYQIDLVAAANRSRQQMDATLRQLCAQQIHGDTYRNLVVDANYHDQTFKHILAPVWLLTYNYGAKGYHVIVNGVTGRITGSRPWSWVKVSILITIVLIIVIWILSKQ